MKFKDLPDGSNFQVEEDVKAGMNVIYVKAVEDGPPHNAVKVDNSSQTVYIADNIRVIQL